MAALWNVGGDTFVPILESPLTCESEGFRHRLAFRGWIQDVEQTIKTGGLLEDAANGDEVPSGVHDAIRTLEINGDAYRPAGILGS